MIDLKAIVHEARERGDYNLLLDTIPYARFLGMRARLTDDRVRIHVPFRDMLVGNAKLPSIHGGVAGACLETAALLQLIHESGGHSFPKTIDFTIDYLRQARGEDLFAEAEVQRAGRRMANVRMRAFQQDASQPVVLGRGNFLLET
jgi:uncharacterized protein (TIGR00369 family)